MTNILSMGGSLAHSTKNDTRFEDAVERIRTLGKTEGMGRDAQVKFAAEVIELAYDGAVNGDEPQSSAQKDHATILTEEYIKSRTGASIHDHKKNNMKKAVSCTRTLIKVGMKTGLGQGQPLAGFNDLMETRKKLKAKPENQNRLDDGFNTIMKWARRQIKASTALNHNELGELCFKKQPDIKTPEEVLEAIRKATQNLYNGKAASGHAQDSSPFIKTMIDAATARLREIAQNKRQS